MLTRPTEHHRRQSCAAAPIGGSLNEFAMGVVYPPTKLWMGDHSRNDFGMPASVVLQIVLSKILEYPGIKMYGRLRRQIELLRVSGVIADVLVHSAN